MKTATASQRTSSTNGANNISVYTTRNCDNFNLALMCQVKNKFILHATIRYYLFKETIRVVDKWTSHPARESSFAHIAKQWFQILRTTVTEQLILIRSPSVGTSKVIRHIAIRSM